MKDPRLNDENEAHLQRDRPLVTQQQTCLKQVYLKTNLTQNPLEGELVQLLIF